MENPGPHSAIQICDWLWHCEWEVLNYPPYSPDLTPNDFHLSEPLKKHLVDKQFATDANVKKLSYHS
jgi:hypothetical protein